MYNHRDDDLASDWRFGTKRLSHRPINVSTVDLAAFVRDEIVGRTIPPTSSASATPPSVVMKLDVEGDELVLLERFMAIQTLCSIDLITWELHKAQLPAKELRFASHAQLWDFILPRQALADEEAIQRPRFAKLREEWERRRDSPAPQSSTEQASHGAGCRTRFVARDDESYLMVPNVPRRAWE